MSGGGSSASAGGSTDVPFGSLHIRSPGAERLGRDGAGRGEWPAGRSWMARCANPGRSNTASGAARGRRPHSSSTPECGTDGRGSCPGDVNGPARHVSAFVEWLGELDRSLEQQPDADDTLDAIVHGAVRTADGTASRSRRKPGAVRHDTPSPTRRQGSLPAASGTRGVSAVAAPAAGLRGEHGRPRNARRPAGGPHRRRTAVRAPAGPAARRVLAAPIEGPRTLTVGRARAGRPGAPRPALPAAERRLDSARRRCRTGQAALSLWHAVVTVPASTSPAPSTNAGQDEEKGTTVQDLLHIVQDVAVVWLIAVGVSGTCLLLVVAGQALAGLRPRRAATARRRGVAGREAPQDRQATA
jgi:hypothetical protein